MEKRISLTIIVMVAVIMGGFTYAGIPQTAPQQNTAIPNGATSVAFENKGNSWTHVVAAFDITNIDGSVKKIYADLWVKPQGTANVDLSSLAGLSNQPLPEGTNVRLNTYAVPNIPTSQVPQGVTDNRVTATADPAQGGQYLAALTPSTSAADPVVTTPRNTVIANSTSISVGTGGGVSISINSPTALCVSAGGASASTPQITSAGVVGPTIASTPRIRIVLPSI